MKTSKRRILMVDDDAGLTSAMMAGLRSVGYDVRSENDASRAMLAVRAFKPDLILLDICMPGKDGGEVAQDVGDQKDTGKIPIVFLTSLMSKEDVARANEHGETILAKPIGIAELARHIEERLGKK